MNAIYGGRIKAFNVCECICFRDSLNNTKSLLEIGIVKWTEYEDQFSEATEWLTQTEQLVQSFNKLQDSLEEKKNVLEQFQIHLQTLFDWQKELDRLNMKAQMLLETCADTRISNAITQLTTKYNALLSLAKEIMRRLELHYQVDFLNSDFLDSSFWLNCQHCVPSLIFRSISNTIPCTKNARTGSKEHAIS